MTVGLTVTHRRYVTYADAHYGGNLVNGAYVLDLFGDVGTEASIRMDGDEGLLASYSDVQFRAPVRAGDVIEVTATVTAVGRRSRQLAVRGLGGVPRRPGAGRLGGHGARRAGRGGDRDGHRRRAARRGLTGGSALSMTAYRSPQVMVTLRVVGDDIAEYLAIGSHFGLWSGHDLGRGVVTRRLHL